MNKELYEAIKPARRSDVEKEGLISRWANKSPNSIMVSVIILWFSLLIGSGIWIKLMD